MSEELARQIQEELNELYGQPESRINEIFFRMMGALAVMVELGKVDGGAILVALRTGKRVNQP